MHCRSNMKLIINDIPKSLNKYAGRKNEWEYRADKKLWKELVYYTALPQRPPKPYENAVVTIEYFFKTRTRHDADNYNGKMILDGLTACGIIEDDSFGCIELRLKGNYDKNNPRTEITVEPRI